MAQEKPQISKQEDPFNYIYESGEKVEIEGQLLIALINYMNMVVDDNTESYSPYKYTMVDTSTGKTVKNPKKADIETGKVTKILDIENTFKSQPRIYMKPIAVEGAKLSLNLQRVHLDNIEKGKAIKLSEPSLKEEVKLEES